MQIHVCLPALALGIVALIASSMAEARDRALVVGVNEYLGIVSGGRPGGANLSGAVPDAETFTKILVDIFKFEPGDIKLLTDEQATKANILEGFQDWLIDGSHPGDRIVFYFSGHGATAVVKDASNKRLTSTIVPSDAQGDLDKTGSTVVGMIEGKTIGALLAKLDHRHVMVVADSCQSGSVTRALTGAAGGAKARTISEHIPVGMDPRDITRGIQIEAKTDNRLIDGGAIQSGPSDLEVWSAATIQQVTFDLPDGSGGIFTQSFAQGLRDKKAAHAPDGEVTAGNLLQYVRDQAAEFCKTQPGCRTTGLTPELRSPATYLTSVLNPFDGVRAAAAPTEPQIAQDATNLFTHRNDFPLSAEILPSALVRQGETVKFRITSGAPGTLVVIDIGPDGNPVQIFPNKRSEQTNKNGHIRSDAPMTIPDASYGFVFTASHPGPGKLLVLVAEEGVELWELLASNLSFKSMSKPEVIISGIADKLNAPKITPDLAVPNGSHHWAFVTAPYEVLP